MNAGRALWTFSSRPSVSPSETIQLVVKVRNLQLGLKIDIIFDVGPDAILRSLPILAQEHENGQENGLEGTDGEKAKGVWIERRGCRNLHGVHRQPDCEENQMNHQKRNAARETRRWRQYNLVQEATALRHFGALTFRDAVWRSLSTVVRAVSDPSLRGRCIAACGARF